MADGGESRRRHEERVLFCMIRVYCRARHRTHGAELCSDCTSLAAYAAGQIARCRFIQTKTFCSLCPSQCYRPDMKKKIREVMRFSGPRMLFYHPILAARHLALTMKIKKGGLP